MKNDILKLVNEVKDLQKQKDDFRKQQAKYESEINKQLMQVEMDYIDEQMSIKFRLLEYLKSCQ